MHCRLFIFGVKPEAVGVMREFYETRVRDELSQASECRWACLMYSTWDPEVILSLTIWGSEESIDKYEHTQGFLKMLEENKEFIINLNGEESESPLTAYHYKMIMPQGKFSQCGAVSNKVFPMFNIFRVSKDKRDLFLSNIENTVMKKVKGRKGYTQDLLLESTNSPGLFLYISVWEDADSMQDFSKHQQSQILSPLEKYTIPLLPNDDRRIGPVQKTGLPNIPFSEYKSISHISFGDTPSNE